MNPNIDGVCSWVTAVSGFFLYGVFWGILFSFGIFYVALLKDFPGKESETAWIISINYGVLMLITPLTIRICRRLTPRMVSCTGVLLASVSLYLSSLARNLATLYVTFGIMFGVATNFCYFTIILVLRANFDKHLDLAWGISSTGGGVGGIAFGLLLPALVESRGWRGAFQLLSYMIFGFMVCGLVMISSVRKADQLVVKSAIAGDVEHEERSKRKSLFARGTWFQVIRISPSSPWRNRAFVVLSVAICLASFVQPVPYCHIVNYAIQQGVASSDSNRLPLFICIGSTVGRLLIGRLSGFHGISQITLTQVTFLVLCLSTTLCTLATSTAWLILFSVVFGAFDGYFAVLIAFVVDDVFTDKQKSVQGLGNLFAMFCIPYVLASPLAGWLYKVTGSYHTVFFCCGAVLFVSSSLMSLVRYLLPHRTAVEILENGVESSADGSSTKLIPSDQSNRNISLLVNTRVRSLLDLSVEIFTDALSSVGNRTPSTRSEDFQIIVPGTDSHNSWKQTQELEQISKMESHQQHLANESWYTDITAQISGANHFNILLCKKDGHVIDAERMKSQVFSEKALTSKHHVFDMDCSDGADGYLECYSDVITDDQGYTSANAAASFEDSDTKLSQYGKDGTQWA